MSVMIKFHKESLVDRRLPWIEISLDYKTIFIIFRMFDIRRSVGPYLCVDNNSYNRE